MFELQNHWINFAQCLPIISTRDRATVARGLEAKAVRQQRVPHPEHHDQEGELDVKVQKRAGLPSCLMPDDAQLMPHPTVWKRPWFIKMKGESVDLGRKFWIYTNFLNRAEVVSFPCSIISSFCRSLVCCRKIPKKNDKLKSYLKYEHLSPFFLGVVSKKYAWFF